MRVWLLGATGALLLVGVAQAATITVLTAGAFRPVVLAVAPEFERRTGDTLVVEGDTAGALQRRILAGDKFDLAIVPPGTIVQLAAAGKVEVGSERVLGRTGVGVVVAAADTPSGHRHDGCAAPGAAGGPLAGLH